MQVASAACKVFSAQPYQPGKLHVQVVLAQLLIYVAAVAVIQRT
jgi:hypothetical protein